ncbi:MAG: TonB-dependent receptor domain-containing protein, partial [Opitutaceae bacterium]
MNLRHHDLPLRPGAMLAKALKLTVLFAFVSAVLAGGLSAASAGTGTIVGRVSNQATGDALIGAMVTVPGTGAVAYTGDDGTFTLVAPAGPHSLEVQYTGLTTAEVPVNVTADVMTSIDVRLTSAVYRMQKFTVHTLREADAQALQEERALPNLSEITSTDAFGVPSPNPGELLMRLPEISADITGSTVRTIYVRGMPPNFANIMIDGDMMASSQGTSAGRNIQIEQYNTSQLQEVQLLLEPTPDMDGDQIGGAINFITKRVFDVPNQMQLTLATNWIDTETSGLPAYVNPGHLDFDLLYNHTYSVFGGHDNLGIEVNLNENSQAATTQTELGAVGTESPASGMLFPGVGGNTFKLPMQTAYGAGYIHYIHPSMDSGGFDIDYKLGPASSFSLRTTYNDQVYDQQYQREWIFVSNSMSSFEPGSTPYDEQTLPTAAYARSYASEFTKKSINYSINPELLLSTFDGSGSLDVNLAYSQANVDYPSYNYIIAQDKGTGFHLDRIGAGEYTPNFTQTSGPSYSDPASYIPYEYVSFPSWNAPDALAEARLDYTQHLPTSFASFIKAGLKYSNETRRAYEDEDVRDIYSGPTNEGITPWLGDEYAIHGSGPYPFLNMPGNGAPNDLASLGYFSTSPAQAFSNENLSRTDTARYQEDLTDGYVEGSATFGPLNLLGGVRFEHTVVEGQQNDKNPGSANTALSAAQNVALADAEFGPIGTDTAGYNNVLPGVFLTYKPFVNTLIKGSYNITVTRPPVQDILPGESVDVSTQTIAINNPALVPYTSQNWELNIAQYLPPIGQFEAGIFVKQIKNYIAAETTYVGSGLIPNIDAEFGSTYPGYTVDSYVNFGTARFRGCYFAYQQQFSKLPGLLAGIGLYGNMTFLETQGNYGGKVTYENLAGFTPFTANYGISYVHGPVQARLFFNYRGAYLYSGNTFGTNGAVMTNHRTIATLSGDYRFNRTWDAFMTVNNLGNEYTFTES